MRTFCHRTTWESALAIAQDGFADAPIADIYAAFAITQRGVWILDHPVDSNRVAGDQLVVFELPIDVSMYQFGADIPLLSGSGWFVPAAVLNQRVVDMRTIPVIDWIEPGR